MSDYINLPSRITNGVRIVVGGRSPVLSLLVMLAEW